MLVVKEGFWSFLINEPESIIQKAKQLLTFKHYNFDEKTNEYDYYFQETFAWNEYSCLRFPTGLTKYIFESLPIEKYECIDKERKRYTKDELLSIAKNVQSINPNFELRDYQIEACLIGLNRFNSLIQSATGSGKTSILSMICKVLKNDIILIKNGNNAILQQIYERLISFGINDVSWNPSAEPDYTKKIVLINNKSSDIRLKANDEPYIKFLSSVNTMIEDEAQHMQSLTAFQPILYTDPEKFKRLIGFSGSPYRTPDFPYKNDQDFRTIAIYGEPAFKYDMCDTISDGAIVQPYSYFIRYNNYKPYLPEKFKDSYFMQYRMGITYNKSRNAAGLAMIRFLNKNNVATLCCVSKIKNGLKLMEVLAEEGIKCKFICGGTEGKNLIYEYIKDENGKLILTDKPGTPKDIDNSFDEGYKIIFGSTVMAEGVDIQRFQAVVLFIGAKNYIGTTQMIGRAVRKKKSGKNIAFVIDFRDVGSFPVLSSHYEIRKKAMAKNGIINVENVQDFCKMIENLNKEE